MMQTLKGLVFAHSILFCLKLCSSNVYLKPDFELQNVYDSDEFLPGKYNFVILRNVYVEPTFDTTKVLKKAIQGYKLAKIGKTKDRSDDSDLVVHEIDTSDLDDEEIDGSGLNNEEIESSGLDNEVTDESDEESTEIDDTYLEMGDLNLNNAEKSMLRKRWRSSCDKKASRTCAAACKNAYKIVCSSYKCRRKMKRDFKKECKRNCKSKFVQSVSSVETE